MWNSRRDSLSEKKKRNIYIMGGLRMEILSYLLHEVRRLQESWQSRKPEYNLMYPKIWNDFSNWIFKTNSQQYCSRTENSEYDTDSNKHPFPVFPTGSWRHQFLLNDTNTKNHHLMYDY